MFFIWDNELWEIGKLVKNYICMWSINNLDNDVMLLIYIYIVNLSVVWLIF